jgi:anti-sigma B factor antagonist
MSNPTPFRIDGELTIYRAAELGDALKTVMAGVPDGHELEVDLSDVTEMDSAGVQLLMAAKKTARASGREVRITGRSPAVDEVFATLRLGAHFADVSTSPLAASNP